MPATYRTPGVYVEEIPSGVRPIAGVSTSDTAFVDFFPRGPVDPAKPSCEPVRVTSWGDFVANFGGVDDRSEASYAVQQYFLNGGSVAWVVRVVGKQAAAASLALDLVTGPSGASGGGASGAGASGSGASGAAGSGQLVVTAISPGEWGKSVDVGVDYKVTPPDDGLRFNLIVRERGTQNGRNVIRSTEVFRDVSMDKTVPNYVVKRVNTNSALVRLAETGATLGRPKETGPAGSDLVNTKPDLKTFANFTPLAAPPGSTSLDGDPITATDLVGDSAIKTGLYALDKIAPEIFNILCVPAAANMSDSQMQTVLAAAATYCEAKRAFLLVDPPRGIDDATTDQDKLKRVHTFVIDPASFVPKSRNAAVYFPRLRVPDEAKGFTPRGVGPSGTLAGIFARTDASRGVWKAPAGTEAGIRRAALDVALTDDENETLNPFGVNALRTFPIFGSVVWGARTLEGADQQASEYKYVPVRRTALFIEESLVQGLKWVVFEPNDEPLWASIRLNVTAFMQGLFRQRAFQGATPAEAYLVKCDGETTTQADIDLGRVNILVGFAPLKPAEFVIIQIQQLTGQAET
jgi:phage tail sheath protein FI